MENAQLQRGQAQSYALESQVKELKEALNESQEQQALHQAWHLRQVEHWKSETEKLQSKLSGQVTSREAIRGEYVSRIESLEAENYNLRDQLEKKETQWKHQVNLKDRTLESLKVEVDRLMMGGASGVAEMPSEELVEIVDVPANATNKTANFS